MTRYRFRWTILLAPALLLSLFLPSRAQAQETDVAAIKRLQTVQADAWNSHDGAAYSELFELDGDVVNVMGWRWRGREEIAKKLSAAFSWVFRESILTIADVDVRMLDPKNAVAHVRWTMTGAKAPPGSPEPPRAGIQLQVLRKDRGRWRIVSLQNTNTLPEAEFPQGPPPATPKSP